jgi:purine-nucleoside phosphorylase
LHSHGYVQKDAPLLVESGRSPDWQLVPSLQAVRQVTPLIPRVGIILGSGLGRLAESMEKAVSIPYSRIPGLPQLSAAGHAGEWVVGYFQGVPTVMMRGRAHLYEGHPRSRVIYGVRLMKAMGANLLIASNAAGGVNPRYAVGDVVMIDSHLDFLQQSNAPEGHHDSVEASLSHSTLARGGCLYDLRIREVVEQKARELGLKLSRGTYLATLGPSYETRAEYRAFRKVGADMVGMSTVPETMMAARLGMKVLAFSVITNMATSDSEVSTSHGEVLSAANAAQATLIELLRHVLPCIET